MLTKPNISDTILIDRQLVYYDKESELYESYKEC